MYTDIHAQILSRPYNIHRCPRGHGVIGLDPACWPQEGSGIPSNGNQLRGCFGFSLRVSGVCVVRHSGAAVTSSGVALSMLFLDLAPPPLPHLSNCSVEPLTAPTTCLLDIVLKALPTRIPG